MIFSIVPMIAKINDFGSFKSLREEVFGSFTITGILTFITGQYSFSIITELILTLVLSMLIVIQVVVEHEKEENLNVIFNTLIAILSLIIIGHSCINLVIDFAKNNSIDPLFEYFSDFVFWLINIPLFFIWQYVGQFDIMENFMSHKKTSLSLFKSTTTLILKKLISTSKKINSNIISDIHLGGLGERCYLVMVNSNYKEEDIDKILILFSIGNVNKKMYKKYNVKKVLPYKVRIIDNADKTFIKSWIISDMQEDYYEILSDF